jgi:hypothetical protein
MPTGIIRDECKKDHHPDLGLWDFLYSSPLSIGTKVRVNHDHELKSEWPDNYVVVGLVFDQYNKLDITIADHLNYRSDRDAMASDEWRVEDLTQAHQD